MLAALDHTVNCVRRAGPQSRGLFTTSVLAIVDVVRRARVNASSSAQANTQTNRNDCLQMLLASFVSSCVHCTTQIHGRVVTPTTAMGSRARRSNWRSSEDYLHLWPVRTSPSPPLRCIALCYSHAVRYVFDCLPLARIKLLCRLPIMLPLSDAVTLRLTRFCAAELIWSAKRPRPQRSTVLCDTSRNPCSLERLQGSLITCQTACGFSSDLAPSDYLLFSSMCKAFSMQGLNY